MKYLKIFILLTSMLAFNACDDFLDQVNPNKRTTDSFWKTEDDLKQGLSAAYRPLRFNGVYSRWLHVLYISRSDEGFCLSPNPDFQSYSNFLTRNTDDTEGVLYPWLDMYKGIFWANQIIDNAEDTDSDPDLIKRAIGEAYFLRGIMFFNIAGVYGRGPLTQTSFAEVTPEIGEQQDLYEQARDDFKEAIERLPEYYDDSKDLGRATKGAALGMLAKVQAQLKEWDEVESLCREIFLLKNSGGSPLYSLVTNYKDNFTATNENNSESLFEVQFDYGIQAGIELGNQRAKFLGLPVDGVAWDDATANGILKTDMEKEKTIDHKVDPRLKHTLFYYDASNTNEVFYGKTWTQWGLNNSKVYWKKFTNYDTQTLEDYNSGINIRVLRLADIYLLYAEALNELNRTSEAYEYINKVRKRVNMPNLENSVIFTGIGNDQAKMRSQIMHERICELSGECWRWFDLERWGMFETEANISFLKSRDSEFNNFKIGVSNRFPIPYREIPLVQGLNQNPGY